VCVCVFHVESVAGGERQRVEPVVVRVVRETGVEGLPPAVGRRRAVGPEPRDHVGRHRPPLRQTIRQDARPAPKVT